MEDYTNINIGIFLFCVVFGMAPPVAQSDLEYTLYRSMTLNFWSSFLHPVLEFQVRVITVGESSPRFHTC